MSNRHAFVASLALMVAGALVGAQAPAAPDSPRTLAHVSDAGKAAGTEWAEAERFFCDPNANRANRPDDPEIEPAKLFDNLFVMGRSGTAIYAITTPEGIILIDAGFVDQVESLLLPSLAKLGLAPAQIKYVLVTHGHADHFGGAKYLQDHFGAKVAVSARDWEVMERPPAPGAAVPAIPARDLVLEEGRPVTLGGETVTVVAIPGHTPGAVGVVFPVKSGRATHTAALFGGTVLIARNVPDEGMRQYVSSIDHFAEVTRRMKVDVEVQNHPLYDGFLDRLAALRSGRARTNPFIVGAASYQKFLAVMSACAQAQITRRPGA